MAGARSFVLLPITTCVADGARLRRVPETVIAGPPGVRVWPAMVYFELLSAVYVWEPKVNGGGVVAGDRSLVLLPMITCVAAGARLMGVPDTVIAGPPGTRVLLAITYAPAGLAVKI